MNFHIILGYLSGLYFIRPDLDAATLFRTTAVVHVLDAILCGLIAGQSGRSKKIWTAAGLCFGIWALATIFVLPAKRKNLVRPTGC
ncbi:MAG: hypothetical protein ACREQP_09110 [Candidatus Binatia bacterium]